MRAKVTRVAVPLREPRDGRVSGFEDERRAVRRKHGRLAREREDAAQIRGVGVGVLEVGLRKIGVMWLEMPVDDLAAQMVVAVRRQMDVFRRQHRQADDAQRDQAGRRAPEQRFQHLWQYIGRKRTGPSEEFFRKTSVDRVSCGR